MQKKIMQKIMRHTTRPTLIRSHVHTARPTLHTAHPARMRFPAAILLAALLTLSACGGEDAVETSSSGAMTASDLLYREAAAVNDGALNMLPGADARALGGTSLIMRSQQAAADDAGDVSGETAAGTQPLPGDENFRVHGIYVTGAVAGIDRINELIELADETDINAFVIDIKNDAGEITYRMNTPTVTRIGSDFNYIPDMEGLIAKCKEHNIYLIARIVSFKDPFLAKAIPEYALHTADGSVFHDSSGIAWMNPYEPGVWDYLMEIATEVTRIGFDEVQFDYIRFPTDRGMANVVFGDAAEDHTKIDIINEFTIYARETLSPLSVIVSADVFGTIIDNSGDQSIVGQDYAEMASNLDIICPMIYPSHYGSGSYNINVPDANPYLTISKALGASRVALDQNGQDTVYALLKSGLPSYSRVRPWLQAFTATWVSGHIQYGREQIQEQIQAVYDAGYDEWILWNASSRYDPAWF